MRLKITLALLVASGLGPLFATEPSPKSSTVTLPIETYHEYLEMKRRPSVTVIDEVILSGRLSDGRLSVRLRGEASGTRPTAQIFELPEGTRLRKCGGEALITRSENGYVLLPKSDRFTASCELTMNVQEALSIQFSPAVMDVRAEVPDASVAEEPSSKAGIHLLLSRKAQALSRRQS